jgi:hypothetical protein
METLKKLYEKAKEAALYVYGKAKELALYLYNKTLELLGLKKEDKKGNGKK